MTSPITAQEIRARAAKLPELPVVRAASMLYAQGYKPTPAERAAIKARIGLLVELGLPASVNVRVEDSWGAHIGFLTFAH